MATNIDKALYQAPQGIEDLMAQDAVGPEIEIEIEDPESVTIGADGEPILRIEQGEDEEPDFSDNLAEHMSEEELHSIADRKSTRLNSSHSQQSRMPSSA